MEDRIIVAHPGQQHSYHTAVGLKKAGMLYKYITTVYYKKWSITWLCSMFMHGDVKKRALSRHEKSIADNEVITWNELNELLNIAIRRFFHHKVCTLKFYDKFGKKVAKYAISHNVQAVIMYDTTALSAFKYLENTDKNIIKILDMSSANRAYILKIFLSEWRKGASIDIDKIDYYKNPELLKRYLEEIYKADYFLVASQYVAKSLEFSGISRDKMIMIPYGVDVNQFTISTHKKYDDGDIKFLYVGRVTCAKGCNYLLEAFSEMQQYPIQLYLYGDTTIEPELVKKYKEYCNIHFCGVVRHEQMCEIYNNSDVMIVPSLTEGLSLSGLEAMCSGLPIICTENSGVNDLVTDGKEGFVIPIGNVDEIINKIKWFIDNTEKINIMGEYANKKAKNYSWETYEKKVFTEISKILVSETGLNAKYEPVKKSL